jgi:hypothetical protein
MARPKKEESGEVNGRALVDIPSIGAKCGEFVSIPADLASQFEQSGDFDPKAVKE